MAAQMFFFLGGGGSPLNMCIVEYKPLIEIVKWIEKMKPTTSILKWCKLLILTIQALISACFHFNNCFYAKFRD